MKEFKTFLLATMSFKPYLTLYFAGFLFFKVATSLFFGLTAIPVKIIIEMCIISFLLTSIQFACFPQRIFKSQQLKFRTMLWAILVMGVIGFAYFNLQWFAEVPSWMVVILFIMMLIAMAVLWGMLWLIDDHETMLLNKQLQTIKDAK